MHDRMQANARCCRHPPVLLSVHSMQAHKDHTVQHAGMGSRVRARVAHRLMVIVVQYISFEAADIQVAYKQAGMPGPKPTPGSPLEGMDAVCLEVRKIGLHPTGDLVRMLVSEADLLAAQKQQQQQQQQHCAHEQDEAPV